MRLFDFTSASAAENLALDEALLEQAEHSGKPSEALRIWEADRPLAVIGRSSQVDVEVNREACRRRGVPVLRRASGGAAIVTGPGCLMYAVVLSHELRPTLRAIDETHRFVLNRLVEALGKRLPGVSRQGTSDLAWGDRKFSGNSMRAKRTHLLYHGTLLYDFPLELVGECLGTPPRQPEYRQAREHEQFVTNVPLSADELRAALVEAWEATQPLEAVPWELARRLVEERYAHDAWNYKR